MKFNEIFEDIATLKAKYQAKKEKEEALAAKKADFERDLEVTRTRLHDVHGNMIPMKYLKSDDERYTKYLNGLLNKFDAGTLLIDFAINPKNKKEVKLEVEFRGDCIWLFSKGKQSKYEENAKGPIQIFDSVSEFIRSLTTSIYEINQNVDKKAVRDNLFDPESLERVVEQIYEFAEEYPGKTRSLVHKDDQWDMEVKFRRSLRRLSGSKFPKDNSSQYVIYPAISAENRWGKIISPKEKESLDPSLWEQIQAFAGK